MKNRLSILAGVLLAAGLFAQEIEEAEIENENAVNLSVIASKNEQITTVEKTVKIDTAVNISQTIPPVETVYMIDTLKKDNNSFSGGFGFGVYAFDMSPVKRLISVREKEELLDDTSNTLRISDYNFLNEINTREAIPAFRATFYGINETKFHIGGVIEIAGRTWRVKNYEKDSTVTMGFIAGKLGVLMEQVFVHNERNYLAVGGTVGGGGTGVGFFGREGTASFWGNDDNDYDYDDDDSDDEEEDFLGAGSGFVFLDVNLTYILSISKHLHLRFDALCNIMGSRNGYNFSGDDYGIVNAGGALSFVWGSKQ